MAREALVSLLLAGAVLAVYAQATGFEFVDYDDRLHIVQNPAIHQGLSLEGLRWSFTAFHSGNWTPLTWASFQLDYEIAGLDPAWFHGVNVALHLANVLLAFWVLRSLSGAVWRPALAAGLFAVHPLHVESVAWVTERKDVLSTFFFWLALASWTGYARRGGAGRYSRVALCLGLGLLAKQMLVSLPLVLLLLDYWPLRRLASDGDSPLPPERRKTPWALLLEKLPLLLICAGVSALTILAQAAAGATVYTQKIELPLRLINALVSYVRYLGKALWPTGLSPLYAHPNLPGGRPWSEWEIAGAAAVLLALTGLVLLARRRRYPLVGWIWFLVTLVPVIGVFQVGPQAMADRYAYLPHIGLYLLVAWAVGDWLEGRGRRLHGVAAVICVGVLVALALTARVQAGYWRESFTLDERAISVATDRENAMMHFNYANALKRKTGDLDGAIEHYRRALELDPDAWATHFNLANTLRSRGDWKGAVRHYEEALRALELGRPVTEGAEEAVRRALIETQYRLRALEAQSQATQGVTP